MKPKWTVIFSVALVLLFAGASAAQVSTSRITGTVMDESGAVIPGAKVVLTNEATGITYETTATDAGTYVFDSLVVGSYTVAVEAAGFKKWVSTKNVVNVGAPIVVDAKMAVGEITSTVTVESTYERLATSDAMISDVVSRRSIQDLPLNGRNPLNLIILQPGLIQRSSGGAGSGTHINGSRDRAFNVTLDGIDLNEPSVPNPQSNTYRLTTDNVQEYRIVTSNATAEFGRNSGANVAMASRSGTNQIHGNIVEYFRNPILNANDYFNNLLGVEKPNFKVHQFGADVGGPVIKDRTFWFFSWQSTRLNFTQPIAEVFGTPIVYTDLARQGIYRFVRGTVTPTGGSPRTSNAPALVDAQGNLLPGVVMCSTTITNNCIDTYNVAANDPAAVGLDPTMQTYVTDMPLPNNFTSGDGLNTAAFSWNPPSSQPELRFLVRIDHKFNDSNSIFGRFVWTNSDTKQGDFLNSRPMVFPGYAPRGLVDRRPRNLALSYRRVFSPRLVNELTVGLARFQFDFAFGRANPAFDATQPSNNIPPFNSANLSEPFNNQSGTSRWLNTYQYIDNISYNLGKHFLRGGINFRMVQHNDQRSFVGGVVNAPSMTFGSARIPNTAASGNPFNIPLTGINTTDQARLRNMISDLLGLPTGISQSFFASGLADYTPSGLYVRGVRYKQFDSYFQDEWKILRNLTLNLGVRWEWNRPATESNNLILRADKQIDDFASGPVTFIPGDTMWDRENINAIAPRISLAWDPWSTGKTVVRAGFTSSFDPISTFQLVPVLGLVPGSSARCAITVTNTNTPTPGTSSAVASANCTNPAGTAARVSTGFPLALPQPTVPPSAFTALPAQATSLAPPAGGIDPNLKTTTVYDWTLNIQHDLGKSVVLQVGYVGKRGTHLLLARNLNQVRLDPAFLQTFAIARNNMVIGCDADGTVSGTSTSPCTATGAAVPTLLNQMICGVTATTCSNVNSTTVTGRLFSNAAGSLANLIDAGSTFSTSYTNMVAATGRADYFRANPQYSSIFYLDASADSYYHALQVHLRRQERNLNFGLGYTLGKSIDNGSIDPVGATSGGAVGNNSRSPTDVRNLRADRGRSDFDRRQVLTGHVVWDLPFGKGQRWAANANKFWDYVISGWTGTSIVTVMSGEPFSVLSGNFTNSDVRNSRVDIVGGTLPTTGIFFPTGIAGPTMFAPNDLPQFNLNGTAFRIPAPGTNGNSPRNGFTGPSYWNVDMGITKKFPITERINLQFRAEFFNAFNHANFDNPLTSSDGTTTAFGANATTLSSSANFARLCCVSVATPSTTALISVGEAARVIQFALRLNF